MHESYVSLKLRLALTSLGAEAWKCSDRFHASRPDLLVFHNGKTIAVEAKIHPNKPTPLQDLTLNTLAYQKIDAYVLTYHKLDDEYILAKKLDSLSQRFKDIKAVAQWLLKPLS